MPTHYTPPFSAVVWIVAAVAAALSQIWFWRRTALTGIPRAAVCGIRLLVTGGTAWLLANPMTPWHGTQQPSRSLLLLDVSASMDFKGADGLTRADHAAAVHDAVVADATLAGRVDVAWFGERLHPGTAPT